ncbi:hypothetical protein PNOK_0500500 [Pyrrhoderma noxium]|uniref:Transcriptional regulator n=1 Tax=Pyrrhoderma noxium TaxID=2282107 RepID=A0A286UKC9_9AGAM|nr:hypothetical protein PNOK_0500500 [Pyrrhoderma noxium]
MSSIELDKVIDTAKDILKKAHEENKLHDFTNRIVRSSVEKILGLDEGSLDTSEYRKPLKETIATTIQLLKEGNLETPKAKDEKVDKKSKKVKVEEKPKSKVSREKSTNIKSKATIESDEEDAKEIVQAPSTTASSKRKGKQRVISDEEDVHSEPESPPKKRKKQQDERKPGPSNDKEAEAPATPIKAVDEKEEDETNKSESEMSVLIDESPKKKTKKSTKKSKETTKKREKKNKEELSPQEEQIKKLKSLVVACGVRKVWSKELKGCDTPSSQIAHLRKLLADLGMTGRYSLSQAEAIRAKRELAKEMEEVKEFAERFTSKKTKVVDEEEEVSSEESVQGAKRRPKNALQSITAFLQDQSDSE